MKHFLESGKFGRHNITLPNQIVGATTTLVSVAEKGHPQVTCPANPETSRSATFFDTSKIPVNNHIKACRKSK